VTASDITAPKAPQGSPARQRNRLGIMLRVAAMFFIAALSAMVKWTGAKGIPIFEIVFFRNLFAFVPLGLYIWRTTGFSVLRTTRPLAHLTRSCIGLVAMICMFTTLQYLPLTEAAAFNFATPLAMTALSALVLKEVVGSHRWGAIAIGFIGVLIMIKPVPGHFNPTGVFFALMSVMGGAAATVTIRQISATEKGPAIVFYFTLAGTVVGLVGSLFHWVTPDLETFGVLVVAGLVGGLGQMLLTEALRVAPVGVVAPFDYTQLAWATGLGFLLWGELPTVTTLIGASIIAACGGYILYRELRYPPHTAHAPAETEMAPDVPMR